MKKLLLPFLVPLAGFAAVKGFYWYQVKVAADELGQRLAPFASVEYAGIVTGFDGVAGITDIRITPYGSDKPLEIGALRIRAPSWTYFLKGVTAEEGVLPDQLGLELDDVVIDMGSAYLRSLASTEASGRATLGCPKAASGIELMEALGYQRLVMDLELSYAFNPASEFVTLSMSTSVEDDFRLELGTDLDLGIGELTRQGLARVLPRLGSVELNYRDDSFNQRRNRYCAELNGETVPAFVNRHGTLLGDQFRSLGFEFSEALEAAYREFSLEGGALEMTLRAAEPIGFAELAFYGPADYLSALEVAVAINGRKVEPLELGWSAPSAVPEEEITATEEIAVAEASIVVEPPLEEESRVSEPVDETPELVPTPAERFEETAFQKPPSVNKPAFHRVAASALDQHKNSRLRIVTLNGRVIEGTLLSLSRKGLQVGQKLKKGEAILPITFSRIDSVEVFF